MFCYEIAKNSIKSIRDLCNLFNRKEYNILKLKFFVEKETSLAFITETCSVKYLFKFNESTLARGLSRMRIWTLLKVAIFYIDHLVLSW